MHVDGQYKGKRFKPVLGSSQMLVWFLTWFSAQFPKWESIDTFTCENQSENWSQVLTLMRTDHENGFLYILEELNRFSHKIYIWMSKTLCRLMLLLLIFYIFYARLLATFFLFFFQFFDWASVVSIPSKTLD